MSEKRLQKLIRRVTGLAIVLLAVGASKAHTLSPLFPIQLSEEENFLTNNPNIIDLSEQGIGLDPQLVVQAQQRRTALVIGNTAYSEDPLSNPINDATDVADALREMGYEVTLLTNLDRYGMDSAMRDFSRQLRQGGVAFFYYAGHGVQVNGENYLIPIDAQLNEEADAALEAISLSDVLGFMSGSRINVAIIDACRNNPFYRKWRSVRGQSIPTGLARVDNLPLGTAISFATEPGGFAEDGDGQRNSPYTSHLLRHIKTPNLDVVDLFRRVREGVVEETNYEQVPWYQESLIGQEISLNPTTELAAAPTQSPANPPTPLPQQPESTPSPQQPSPTSTSPVSSPNSTAILPIQGTQTQSQAQELSGSQTQTQTQETSGGAQTQTQSQTQPSGSQSQTQSQGAPAQVLQPSPTTLTNEPLLISSATGVNYHPLQDALASGDFKGADRVTRSLMLQATGRESDGWLRTEDVINFPCGDLRIIDQLWREYSEGKFGFSIQQEIYQNLGGEQEDAARVWRDFSNQVGWRVNNEWLSHNNLTFNASAPRGHLPSIYGPTTDGWALSLMASRSPFLCRSM
ncbi:MAG: hypothetical protein Kow00121_26710 [Elainellaceae cyanobacterium]